MIQAIAASLEKVQIFDYWKIEDELIAEGVLLTTEPTEMVNQIPLGPNAAVLRVELVFKPDAFIWRPTPEMIKMGDALHGTIAWPLDKVRLPHSVMSSPAEANKKSNQVSLSNLRIGLHSVMSSIC